MARNAQVHVDDWGTEIRFWFRKGGKPMNISAASDMKVRLRPPGAAAAMTEYVAAFITDGTDGGIKYVTTAGIINAQDSWSAQGVVTLPTGKFHSRVVLLPVAPNLT